MFGLSRNLLAARGVKNVMGMSGVVAKSASMGAIRYNSGGAHAHETESFESFNARYQTFFTSISDIFELQRGLNNCFAYDLVPTTSVIEAALRAARRVDDYATAVRVLEGVKEKVENKGQYKAYLEELKPVIEELGITTKEELYNL